MGAGEKQRGMRRGTAALPSLSALALRPPVVPTGVGGPNKRQRVSGPRQQVIAWIEDMTAIFRTMNKEDGQIWLGYLRIVSQQWFKERFPSREPKDWLKWAENKFQVELLYFSDTEVGDEPARWKHTLQALEDVEGLVNRKRAREKLPRLRDLPKTRTQRPEPSAEQLAQQQQQRDRMRATQQRRGGLSVADQENGAQYFNLREGGPDFERPESLDQRSDQLPLKGDLRRKWPEDLKDRLLAQREPDGGCCAADPAE